jgi:hypothetical protein
MVTLEPPRPTRNGTLESGGGNPRKEHGFNEVAEMKGYPVLAFLGKFRGISA